MDIIEQLRKISTEALEYLHSASTAKMVTKCQSKYLGRKSELALIAQGIGKLAGDERRKAGIELNKVREELTAKIGSKLTELSTKELEAELKSDILDLSLPPLGTKPGKLHPISQELIIISDIFSRMGFEIHEPYLIDDEYHNFTAVNIPEGHPAKDMWDTVKLEDNLVMITHTSSMQNRILSQKQFPIRAIVPGKCFRNEATDATHEHSFFQIEGICVDQNIKLPDLIGTLSTFLKAYFGYNVPLKIQPTYFPFVEPGLEIMMPRPQPGKKPITADTAYDPLEVDWMEVIPCGMIHPNVLTAAGIDPEAYSGFAWGLGLERLVMIKKQIPDLRYFHSGRLDFLRQF